MKTPRIINGICEFCGVDARTCAHGIAPKVAGVEALKQEQLARVGVGPYKLGTDINLPKVADILIAHHDRIDMLAETLSHLPIEHYETIIVRGSSYARANNIAAKASTTDTLIMCNDDMVIPPAALAEVTASDCDLAIAPQFTIDGKPYNCGCYIDENERLIATPDILRVQIPYGGFYKVKRKMFERLRGFSEQFINGGEDIDFLLRLIAIGGDWEFTPTPIFHHISASGNRYDHIQKNEDLLRKIWPIGDIKIILGL